MSTLVKKLEEAYEKLPVGDADILYLYTDFRALGTHISEFENKNEFCRAFVQPLLDRGKTVILTTFSYTTDGRFDIEKTSTNLGVLNKWILKQEGVVRSEHPLFSFAALGPQAEALMMNVGKSAFGFDSVYHRLENKKAAFLHVGRPVSMGNTLLHRVEQLCGATYRIHKAFKTEVFRKDQFVGTDYTAFLRRRDVDGELFEFNFDESSKRLLNENIVKEVGSSEDLTNFSFYWFDETLDCLTDTYYKNQKTFIHSDFIQY